MTAKDHYLTAIHTFWPTEPALKGPFEFHPENGKPEVEPEPAVRDWLEEGDECPECAGLMGFERVENCSCHIAPPCSRCVDNPLVCLKCGYDPEDLGAEPYVPLLERVSEGKRASFNEGMEAIRERIRATQSKKEPEPALRHYCGGTMAPVGESYHHACLKCGFILSNEKLLNMSEADREKFAAPAEPEPAPLGWAMMEEGVEAPYYLTQGKRYPLITDGENAFTILCDDGTTTHCAWKVSSHLGYHKWIRIPPE